MDEQKAYLKTSFSYTDEFGETTTLSKTHDANLQEDSDTYFLMEQFKTFLLACGYSEKWVNKIMYLDDDEEITKKLS